MRKKKVISIFVAMLMLLGIVQHSAQAQPPFVVACPEYPPWRMAFEDGGFGGIDIELIQILAKRMGLPLVVEEMPWHRAIYMLETGEVDMLSNVFKTPARERFLHFLDPPYRSQSRVAFYVLKGKEHQIARYEDLRYLHIGTIKDILYFPRFDTDRKLDKKPVMAELQNPTKLLRGHIDTFIESEVAGDWTLKQAGLQDRIGKADYSFAVKRPVCLALSKRSRHAGRLTEFNRTLRELVRKGVVDQLIDKYLGRKTPEP